MTNFLKYIADLVLPRYQGRGARRAIVFCLMLMALAPTAQAQLPTCEHVSVTLLGSIDRNTVRDTIKAMRDDFRELPGQLCTRLSNYAGALGCSGHWDLSLRVVRAWTKVAKDEFGQSSPEFARSQLALAEVHLQMRDTVEAEDVCTDLFTHWQQSGFFPSRELAELNIFMAELVTQYGWLSDARRMFSVALSIATELSDSIWDDFAKRYASHLRSSLPGVQQIDTQILIYDKLLEIDAMRGHPSKEQTFEDHVQLADLLRRQQRRFEEIEALHAADSLASTLAHEDTWQALLMLGLTYYDVGQHDLAGVSLLTLLERSRTHGHLPGQLAGLLNLSGLERLDGDTSFSAELVRFAQAYFDPTDRRFIEAHDQAGRTFLLAGHPGRAAKILKASLYRPASQSIDTYRHLAAAFNQLHEYDSAIAYLELVHGIAKEAGPLNPETSALVAHDLAKAYFNNGQQVSALAILRDGLADASREDEVSHKLLAGMASTLGTFYLRTGNAADAVVAYRRAMEFDEEVSKDAWLHDQIGRCLFELGHFGEAVDAFQKSQELWHENPSDNLALEDVTINLIQATLAWSKSTILEVGLLDSVAQMIDAARHAIPRGTQHYTQFLHTHGMFQMEIGQIDSAIALMTEAFRIRSAQDSGWSDVGQPAQHIGSAYAAQHRYDQAKTWQRKAYKNAKAVMGDTAATTRAQLHRLLEYQSYSGGESLELLNEQYRIYVKIVHANRAIEAPWEYRAFAEEIGRARELRERYLSKTASDELATQAFNLLMLQQRYQALAEQSVRRWTASSTQTTNEIVDIENQLLAMDFAPGKDDARRRDSLRFLLGLKLKQASQGNQNAVANYEAIRRALAPDEAAIQFSSFALEPNGSGLRMYTAYVIRSVSSKVQFIALVTDKELDSLLVGSPDARYRFGLRGGFSLANQARAGRRGHRLYKALMQPILHVLPNATRLFIAPDRKLHTLAFAAMPDSAGQILAGRFRLTQVLSISAVLQDFREPRVAPIQLFGDVAYDGLGESAADGPWGALSGTLAEIDSISRLYRTLGLDAMTYSGAAANEHVLRNLNMGSPAVLHLATHGFFYENINIELLGDRLTFTTIEGAERQGIGLSDAPPFTRSENPMLRSGLLLAGANRTWNAPAPRHEHDGILTAAEVAGLNLEQTDLVVLSACETGLGDVTNDQGLAGLQRAFRQAGADLLMMSLWEVPDRETAEFMQLFYSIWLGQGDIFRSFRQTQLTMHQRYPHAPSKWAAFVLVR